MHARATARFCISVDVRASVGMFGDKIKNFGVLAVLLIAASLVIPGSVTLANQNTMDDAANDYYLVTFSKLPADSVRAELELSWGICFLEYHQDGTYMIRSPAARVAQISSLEDVTGVVQYSPGQKIAPELLRQTGTLSLRVDLHSGNDILPVAGLIEDLGGCVTKTNSVLVDYLYCDIDASAISEIAEIVQVKSIQPQGEKQTFMNLISSNTYMGSDTPQAGGFQGSGIMAEVMDNGIDRTHTDLQNVDWTDGSVVADSHGTCTSGEMFGTGIGDATALGSLPQAVGAFADWGTGDALSIANLWNGDFNEGSAGMNGIVQTNSWYAGGNMDGTYTAVSNEIDTAAVNYPHVLNHWAIGNSNYGTQLGGVSQDSSNKNSMAVGAIFHGDTAALGDDEWYDAGSGMTPSRGPCADGRQHPDMCGPFDWIHTVDQTGAAGYTGTNYYDDFGGTSGATPSVAGCSGLTYEMYHEDFFDNNAGGAWPYSCTVKALMIADAYQYPIGTNLIDRNVEGWGTPDMENMYNLGATYHVIDEYPQAMSSGSTWSHGVYADGTYPLKITLCWIDPAAPGTTGSARSLINNLDLRVVSPGGTVYYGNNGLWTSTWSASGTVANHWSSTGSYRDDLNNVENVFIQSPQVGLWTVEVTGRTGDVAQGPQDFSVVASGAQGISSIGTIGLNKGEYLLPDTIQATVQDLDLNTNPTTIQTVNVNIASTIEPAGETVTLTETGVDTNTFVGTIALSSTNSVGVLWGAHGNTITATYNDADAGGAGPATVTDTATVDAQVLAASGLTVEWWGETFVTLIDEHFAVNPAGWTITHTAGTAWTYANQRMENTYGYPNSGYLDSPVVDCSGLTGTTLSFWHFWQANYGTSQQDGYVRGSIDGGSTWPYLVDEFHHNDPATETAVKNYAIGWADGHSLVRIRYDIYNNDDWYWRIDDVLMTAVGGSTTENNWLNWTLSGDDGAGANDVDHYNIYRALTASGPWDATALIDTVPAGTATYMDYGRGEPDGIVWWYVVRAVDDAGNLDPNTDAVPEFGTPDTTPPGAPTGLTVEWYGPALGTWGSLFSEGFSTGITDGNWQGDDLGSGTDVTCSEEWWEVLEAAADLTDIKVGVYNTPPSTQSAQFIDCDALWAGQWMTAHYNGGNNWFDLTPSTNAYINFSAYGAGFAATEGWRLEITTNGGTGWTTAIEELGTTAIHAWQNYHYQVPYPGSFTNQFGFRINVAGSAATDIGTFDDITLDAFTPSGPNYDDNTLNWTLSSDDGAGADDVVRYNIYRAIASSGPWDSGALIDNVPAGTATYLDVNRGQSDGITWWYVVRAQDLSGNEDTNTNSVPEPSAALPYSIDLTGKSANSWVYVSFPSATSGNIQTILNDATAGDGLTTWTVAKWFNVQTPSDPWKTYRVGSTVNDLTTISSTMGVWLWITANGGDQALTLNAYVAPSATAVTVNLYTGWNMVGYPTMTSRAESTTLPAAADFVATWQAATPYISQHAKGATLMVHGNAYWVHVTADCTWVVNP